VDGSPCYSQSNGKLERLFKTLKRAWIRVKTPLNVEDAQRLVFEFVNQYNMTRLHSAKGYITPADKAAGRADAIWPARRPKPAAANAKRRGKAKEKAFA